MVFVVVFLFESERSAEQEHIFIFEKDQYLIVPLLDRFISALNSVWNLFVLPPGFF